MKVVREVALDSVLLADPPARRCGVCHATPFQLLGIRMLVANLYPEFLVWGVIHYFGGVHLSASIPRNLHHQCGMFPMIDMYSTTQYLSKVEYSDQLNFLLRHTVKIRDRITRAEICPPIACHLNAGKALIHVTNTPPPPPPPPSLPPSPRPSCARAVPSRAKKI